MTPLPPEVSSRVMPADSKLEAGYWQEPMGRTLVLGVRTRAESEAATTDLGTWAYHSAIPLCKTGVTGLEKAPGRVRNQTGAGEDLA